jgi:hypothetical protein
MKNNNQEKSIVSLDTILNELSEKQVELVVTDCSAACAPVILVWIGATWAGIQIAEWGWEKYQEYQEYQKQQVQQQQRQGGSIAQCKPSYSYTDQICRC